MTLLHEYATGLNLQTSWRLKNLIFLSYIIARVSFQTALQASLASTLINHWKKIFYNFQYTSWKETFDNLPELGMAKSHVQYFWCPFVIFLCIYKFAKKCTNVQIRTFAIFRDESDLRLPAVKTWYKAIIEETITPAGLTARKLVSTRPARCHVEDTELELLIQYHSL